MKFKKGLSVLLAFVLLLACLPMGAVSISAATYDRLTYEISNGEVTITGHTYYDHDAARELVIPEYIEGYPVTAIDDRAFDTCFAISSVIIPDTVITIGNGAFSYCHYLNSVTVGSGCTTIGDGAFYSCYSLTSVDIKEGVTSIGRNAFSWCECLSSITLPESVTSIGEYAFVECLELASVNIPNGVTSIGDGVFQNCKSLSTIDIPDSVTSIGYEAFARSGLTSIDIPNSVTNIEDYAFSGCTNLGGSVVIPDNFTTISQGMFYGCYSLESITIPESVTYIKDSAFDGCRLRDVYYGGSEWDKVDKLTIDFVNDGLYYATWHYAKVDDRFGVFEGLLYEVVDGEITIIGYTGNDTQVFIDSDLVIPGTIKGLPVTAIGDGAFSGCFGLLSVTIDENVTTIGDSAFSVCDNLYSVTIGGSVTTIDDSAFNGCFDLTLVDIKEGVTSIGRYAFSDTELEKLFLPKSITNIEEYAFHYSDIKDVYYSGGEADKAGITIGYNDELNWATWHYGCINPKNHYSSQVQHSVMDTANGNGLAFRFELTVDGVKANNKNEVNLENATINYLGTESKVVGMGVVVTNKNYVGIEDNLHLNDVNGTTVLDIPVVYLCDLEPDFCAFAARIINIPDAQLERTIYARPYYIVDVDGEWITVYGDTDSISCQQVLDGNG